MESELGTICYIANMKNKLPYRFMPKFIRNKIIKNRINKFIINLVSDKDIYWLSNFVLTMLNANPSIKFDQIRNFGNGFMVIRYTDDSSIEFISNHKCFIINTQSITFEVFDKQVFYGIRKTMWESMEDKLKSIYGSYLNTLIIDLSS